MTTTPPIAVATGTITEDPSGKPLSGKVVYVDTNNDGHPSSSDPIAITDSDGRYILASWFAISGPIRQLDVTLQTFPAKPNTGQHKSVALGAAVDGADFKNAVTVASQTPASNPAAPTSTGPSGQTSDPPATAIHATFGFCAPVQTSAIINAAAAAVKALKSALVRFFNWGAWTVDMVKAWFVPIAEYAALGIASILVLNFQGTGGKVPDLATLGTICDAFPQAPITGCAVEVGNEINLDGYFKDTAENYAPAFKLVSQKLRAKGYKVYVSSVTDWGTDNGQKWYAALDAHGVFAVCDGAGLHAYNGNAADSKFEHQQCMAWLAARGVHYICTETGLHGGADWADQVHQLLVWCAAQPNTTWVYFLLQTPNPMTDAGPEALFDENWNKRDPFYTAASTALGV